MTSSLVDTYGSLIGSWALRMSVVCMIYGVSIFGGLYAASELLAVGVVLPVLYGFLSVGSVVSVVFIGLLLVRGELGSYIELLVMDMDVVYRVVAVGIVGAIGSVWVGFIPVQYPLIAVGLGLLLVFYMPLWLVYQRIELELADEYYMDDEFDVSEVIDDVSRNSDALRADEIDEMDWDDD